MRRTHPGARPSQEIAAMTDARPLVVLGGPIHPDAQALLESEARVVVTREETEAGFLGAAAEADGILIRGKPPATASLLTACKRLRVVGRHGVGLDTVDIPAATRLGVAVVHAPGSNSQAVAEHALMLMLACAKHTFEIDRLTRRGDWSARAAVQNIELGGRTLGIVGVGNVGRRVAKFAGALGMRVLGHDPYVPADELRQRGVEPMPSLETMLPQCDVVTFHTPLTPETRGLLGRKTIALMKPGAIVVNTSRGGVQVEPELFEALTRGTLAAAGLDVWEDEPTSVDNPVFNLPNVVCSAHVAGVTREAHRVAGLQVAGEMLRVLRGERPEVLVNPEVWPRLGQR
jgi:D-3-phosphoglycerate dehydrogenase